MRTLSRFGKRWVLASLALCFGLFACVKCGNNNVGAGDQAKGGVIEKTGSILPMGAGNGSVASDGALREGHAFSKNIPYFDGAEWERNRCEKLGDGKLIEYIRENPYKSGIALREIVRRKSLLGIQFLTENIDLHRVVNAGEKADPEFQYVISNNLIEIGMESLPVLVGAIAQEHWEERKRVLIARTILQIENNFEPESYDLTEEQLMEVVRVMEVAQTREKLEELF